MALIKSLLRRKAVWAVLLLAAGAAGVRQYRRRKAPKPPEDAGLAEVKKGDLEVRFQELGDVAAKSTVNVASKVSGRVIKLFIEEGASVKEGQRLAVIQPGRTGAEKFLPSDLTAPISGVVLRYIKNPEGNNPDAKFVEVGDYVTGLFESQNPTYLLTIADMREVIVRLKINEMDILKLREGMQVEATIDAIPEEKFPAEVYMIAPQAEREARGGKIFRVEVALKRNDPRLRAGMTARIEALLEKREGTLKAPLSALFEEDGRTFAFLDVAGDKPRQVAVKTGLRTELEAEVTDGLKEGDKLLTDKPAEFTAMEKESGPAEPEDARSARRKARRARRAAMRAVRR